MEAKQPRSILFPYTTLFRSRAPVAEDFADLFGRGAGGNVIVFGREAEQLIANTSASPETMTLPPAPRPDRKSTRLNSSHVKISYAVFWLKKKKHRFDKTRVK